MPGNSHRIANLMSPFTIEPATLKDLDWIAQLEAESYSGDDAIPGGILKEWYEVNPTGFFVIKGILEERVGHIDILPVRSRVLQLLLEGAILEREIRGDSLYSPDERDSIRELYVESLAVCIPGRYKAGALLSLAFNLPSLIENIAALEKIETIYAIAATKPGERVIKRLGFEMIRKGEERKDGHPVFAVSFKTLMDNISQYLKRGET